MYGEVSEHLLWLTPIILKNQGLESPASRTELISPLELT
jgi:hypothetical protein